MNPRSDVGSLVCSEGLLLPLDSEGRKGSPERRNLKLFPGSEETSIILVVYAHVGARLAGIPFLPFPLSPPVLRRRRNWGTGQRQVDNGARKLKRAIKSPLFVGVARDLLYLTLKR